MDKFRTPRSVSRMASLGHALRGMRVLWGQPNARIHCLLAWAVTGMGWWLGISAGEWAALVLAMGLVLGAEALNTAVELAVNLAEPEWNALARDAKDVAATGVLLCSFCAALVGLLVLGPHLWARWM